MTDSNTSKYTRPFLYLAPIRGVTDSFFRSTFAVVFGGFDAAVAPFFRAPKGKFDNRVLKDLEPERNKKLPIIPQILTRKPDVFVAAANALEKMGYGEINWNLGCPHPQVAKKGLGAGLISQPQIVDQILGAVLSEVKINVSIKTRLGLDDSDHLRALLPTLNRHNLDKIIIHPRTASQMYDGQVHLDQLKNCLSSTDHNIVYSGDICTADDLEKLQAQFPSVQAWMIGRGCLANPFLAKTIKNNERTSPQEQLRKLFDFHNQLYEHYKNKLNGDSHFLAKMRSIWKYMTPSVPEARKFAKKIKRAKSVHAYDLYIEEFIGSFKYFKKV